MPTTSSGQSVRALGGLIAPYETRFERRSIDPTELVIGLNTLAVSVHQASANSGDLGFDLLLDGWDVAPPPVVTRGPYLQRVTATSATLRWRTDLPASAFVGYAGPGETPTWVFAPSSTEGEVVLGDLQPETRYEYEIAGSGFVAGGDPDHVFETAPLAGEHRPLRIWVLGDSGTGTQTAASVRDAYLTQPGSEDTDLVLMLGDNAYLRGTDLEHRAGLFDPYASILRSVPVWPTIGNHDALSISTPLQSGPYYDAFSLPTAGEAGGVASGTEAYYSFDHANVHFVSLDSSSSSSQPGSPMLTWLTADLAANAADWTIAFWHHPPYSKGSHDSNSESWLVAMRTNVLPILEAAGVDLVLAGHSHAYERSMLFDGHYGASGTLLPGMVLDSGDGGPGSDGAYQKSSIVPTPHSGTVYVVIGSSATLSQSGALDHPALPFAARSLGSVLLEIFGHRLDLRFIDEQGVTLDRFSLQKPMAHSPECSDSVDNDGDGATDFPADSECSDASDVGESPFSNLQLVDDSRCTLGGSSQPVPCLDEATPDLLETRQQLEVASRASEPADPPSLTLRLASIAVADLEPGSPIETRVSANVAVDYSIAFLVDVAADEAWQLVVESDWRGALDIVDDDPGTATARVEPGPLTGTIDSTGQIYAGTTALLAPTPLSVSAGSGDASSPFDRRSIAWSDASIGPREVRLRFRASPAVESTCAAAPCAGLEAALRSGLAGTLPGLSAGSYPGAGTRNPDDDGHFVKATLLTAPEPAG
ncbi:MAG: hypothetical protein CL908_08525, partial [Deltaproteobacteria bacterium]|nr:hypothetical protein [Deltaproteobacteria bacterium]